MKTAQNTIRETIVYTCFVYNSEQRHVETKHVRDLMDSMSTFGFLPSKPVQVYQDGKKFVIIDGHHRYVAAKNLQIPVLYVVEPKSHNEAMARVNRVQKPWALKNYVSQYAKRGLASYLELVEYHNLGFPIMQAAQLLMGKAASSGGTGLSASKHLTEGTFKILTREKIEIIAQFLRENGSVNPAFKTSNFISSFEMCMRVKGFDHGQLTRKLSANPKTLIRTASIDQMLDQIEEIYNYHQQIKTPLAFNARQEKIRGSKEVAK